MLIRLIAPGQPVSAKNNKRGFVHTKRHDDGHVSHYASVARSEAIIAWYKAQVPQLRAQFERMGLATIAGFVHVDVHQYLVDDLLAKQSPDADNVLSAAFDALEKAKVLRTDKLIVSGGFTRQRDAARPRVEIEVRVLEVDAVLEGWR